MSKISLRSAITKINAAGMLLVFPLDNRPEIPSLWSAFFPRSRMRWEWDQGGDTRVSDLWHLRAQLSTSGQVVYGKWFRGRATVMSLEMFSVLLRLLNNSDFSTPTGLTFSEREILDFLLEDSPLSTKQLKRISGMQGRENEAAYQRALKGLWQRLLISVWGEVNEGAFPSIAVGSSQILFEEAWKNAQDMSERLAWSRVEKKWTLQSPFRQQLVKLKAALQEE